MLPGSTSVAVALRLLLFLNLALPAIAGPVSSNISPVLQAPIEKRSSSYWINTIERQGTVAFGNDSSYTIYRNVMDYGATGNGVTDDTAAINAAISDGGRCGQGCDSSTTTPALVYFPPGNYLVSAPIVQYYYTQLVGDALDPPTITASATFAGIAVIDSDPYVNGVNWYTNQNNFYRQIRNFIIDLTSMPQTAGAAIHWQVAQATSLQNIVFNMISGSSSKQIGIFMDNGSGGFMTDLIFNGGQYGAFFGNQQFTSRNMTFNDCQTAIFMNWNWVWALKSIKVNNCGVALDISNNPTAQDVGSALLQDSVISNTPVGVITAFTSDSSPTTGGTLIIDNVDFSSCAVAVQGTAGNTILAGNKVINSWAQGTQYHSSDGARIQTTLTPVSKPVALVTSNGTFFERSKPQYESYSSSSFVSVKSKGAKGDGVTDDTAAIQAAMDAIEDGQILYFDHGAYIITNTVVVPKNIIITGEIWPMIVATGDNFVDVDVPIPVFQVGSEGDVGAVEISDLIFEIKNPQPGAILLQWNVKGSSQGATGIWDVHWRIGGSVGTNLQSDTCASDPSNITAANPQCGGAFLLFHVTTSASVYVENAWFWVADHELDLANHDQINIFNGRGVLIESQEAVWMLGTASEHSQLYNYYISNAQNIYMSLIQTETPYYQSNPNALTPFLPQSNWNDPNFAYCASGDNACIKSWGLKISDSSDVYIYGTGLYSFFDNYSQTCLTTESCQENMLHVQSSSDIYLYGVSTKAAVNMISLNGTPQASAANNTNNFCSTVALWTIT